MDPQVNKKSNVFAYVLLGIIVFIVLILIFDKKNNLYKPNTSKETPVASRQQIINSLSADAPTQNKMSPEQKQSIIKYLSTDSSPSTTPSKKISADQKTQIINSVKAN